MKKGRLKKWDRIEVTWVDSQHTSGWRHVDSYEFGVGLEHTTIGYLIGDIKASVSVVQSKRTNTPEDQQTVDGIMEIPRRAILNIRKL